MELDYEKLGLKCGLEIHQQLETRKLFCNCPSVLRQDEPDFTVTRKLHAVAGERGEVDRAAAYEVSLDKDFVYQGYDTTCLVELDESPPRMINQEALKTALHVALLLNAKIFPITQIMRKTVVDGSNTSGFQRTVVIARNGEIQTKYGRVGIDTVCLEEDSARFIKNEGNNVFYRLDRLGIPLVEIATKPDIKNPKQAKEVAMHIGDILRSCKVKRGLGTIRQDVNVSIRKGARVEIKGVQKPELIEKAVEKEAERQFEISNEKKKLNSEVRKVLPDGKTEFSRPMPGAARMYPETDLPLLKISREMINDAKKTLPKSRGEEREGLKKILSDDLIKLVLDGNLENFKELLEVYPKNPKLVAKMLTLWRREVASKTKEDVDKVNGIINFDLMRKLLLEVRKGDLNENHIKPIFSKLAKGISLEDAVKPEKKDANIEEKIHNLIKSKPGLSENAYMGLAMKEFKDKISGKEAIEIIRKLLK